MQTSKVLPYIHGCDITPGFFGQGENECWNT